VGLLAVQGILAIGPAQRMGFVQPGQERDPNQIDGIDLRQFLLAGELALDGRLRPIRGVIALASLAKQRGARGVIVPAENASEAAIVEGLEVYGVRTLSEVVGLVAGSLDLAPTPSTWPACSLKPARRWTLATCADRKA
jgi:predicted ATPase with chaperone activity